MARSDGLSCLRRFLGVRDVAAVGLALLVLLRLHRAGFLLSRLQSRIIPGPLLLWTPRMHGMREGDLRGKMPLLRAERLGRPFSGHFLDGLVRKMRALRRMSGLYAPSKQTQTTKSTQI